MPQCRAVWQSDSILYNKEKYAPPHWRRRGKLRGKHVRIEIDTIWSGALDMRVLLREERARLLERARQPKQPRDARRDERNMMLLREERAQRPKQPRNARHDERKMKCR